MSLVKRSVDKTEETLHTVLRALDRLQASVDVTTRGLSLCRACGYIVGVQWVNHPLYTGYTRA